MSQKPESCPNEESVLFMTNGDGTFNCAWCERRVTVDLAVPDSNDDPICPECHQGAVDDELDSEGTL
jgi:hypothetical protein